MVNIRNKFLETHCNVRLKQWRLVKGKEQRAGRIPPALKQQAIDESVPYTDIIEANKQK